MFDSQGCPALLASVRLVHTKKRSGHVLRGFARSSAWCSFFAWSRTLLVRWLVEPVSQAVEKFRNRRHTSQYNVATNDRFASSLSHRIHRRLWSFKLTLPFLKGWNSYFTLYFLFADAWLLLVQTCFLWAAIFSVWKQKRSAMCNYWAEIGPCPTAIITFEVMHGLDFVSIRRAGWNVALLYWMPASCSVRESWLSL